MLYKIKFIYLINKLNINFSKLLIYKFLFINFCNITKNNYLKTNNILNYIIYINNNLIFKLYNIFIKFINLKLLKFILLYSYNTKLHKFFLPKKYSLITVLRSPHVDKRSREQFTIIQNKASLQYPLFFSIYNNYFINNFYLFERGFNMVVKTKILK